MLIIGILFILLLIGSKILFSIYINRIIIYLIGYLLINITILINISNIIRNILINNNLYFISNLLLFIKILLYLCAFLINFIGEIKNKKGNILKSSEYNLLTFLSLLGMIILIESYDLISIFLSIELISFPLYILSSLFNYNTSGLGINKDSQSGIKAGLKYLLLGSFTSTLLLGGLVIIYGSLGLTNLNEIEILINIVILKDNINKEYLFSSIIPYIILGYIFILSGLLFKIGSVPFHNWGPDVYDGVPTIVTSWISILPKISFITIISTFFNKIFKNIPNSNKVFSFSSICSLIIGSILGLIQYRIKRLLSYSSITQIGYILLIYSIIKLSNIKYIFFYLVQYSLTSVCIFLILMSLNKYNLIEVLGQLKNLYFSIPLLSFSLTICLFSFMGVPPFIGFFGKLNILYQSIYFGYYFLALIAVLTSIISAGYYLRIIKISNFDFTFIKSIFNMINTYIIGNISINHFIAILTTFISFYILIFDINIIDSNLDIIYFLPLLKKKSGILKKWSLLIKFLNINKIKIIFLFIFLISIISEYYIFSNISYRIYMIIGSLISSLLLLIINPIYADSDSESDSNNTISDSESERSNLNSKITIFNSESEKKLENIKNNNNKDIEDNISKIKDLKIDHNHHIENSTIIGEGLKVLGEGISKIAPAATGFTVGVAAIKGMQTMPGTPNQKLMAGGAAGIMTGTTIIATQLINEINKNTKTDISNEPGSPSDKYYLDNFKESNIFPFDFQLIVDYFNNFTPLEGLLICIFIYALTALLLSISIIFPQIIDILNLKEKFFIKNKPFLLNYINYILKSNKIMILIILLLIIICLICICLISLYLLGSI